MNGFDGKRVWLTGASSGIGAATARALAQAGARLAVSARSAASLQQLVGELPGAGHLAMPLDIADAATVEAAVQRLLADWGGIDLAVLAAGAYRPMRGFELDLGAARGMIETNLIGTLNCVAAIAAPMLQAGSGHIAIVASVAGYRGLPKAAAYGPTKAALINLAESLRLDLGPRGIKVQVINPGFVKTPLTDRNDFRMPALISSEQAAGAILRGLTSSRFEIHFPHRFTSVLKLLRLLPYGLYFPLIRRATGL